MPAPSVLPARSNGDATFSPALPWSAKFTTAAADFDVRGDLSAPAQNARGYARDLVDRSLMLLPNCASPYKPCTTGPAQYVLSDQVDPSTVNANSVRLARADGTAVPGYSVGLVSGEDWAWFKYRTNFIAGLTAPPVGDTADSNRIVVVSLAADANG